MEQPPSKRPRTNAKELNEKIKDFATKVNRGVEEAEYGDDDLTANSKSSIIDKFKKRNEFQIFPMKYEGKVTGWGKCSLCAADPTKKTVFKISEGMSGMKVWLVERHLTTNHATDEEKKITQSNRRDERLRQRGQVPMSDFIQKRQLTPAQISELREINLQIIGTTHVPMSFFSKEIVKKRDERILEMCGFDPKNAQKFDKSRETIKRDARKISDENLLVIQREAPRWAEEGKIAFQIDYKSILNQHGDEEKHGLGVGMSLSDEDHKRHHYLLGFIPSNSTDMDTTILLARDLLQVNHC